MKTRIMILACLLAVPAGRMAAQQQTDPEQKATVQTQGDSIIIRKGKGDMRIKVYEEQLEDGEKKEVQIYEGVYLEKVDADKRTFLDAPAIHPQKEDTMLTNRTVPVCILATAGWLTTSLSFGASDKMGLDLSSHGNSASTSSPYITTSRRTRIGESTWGVSWGYRSFNIDGNYALLKENGTSIFTAGNEDTSYNKAVCAISSSVYPY